MESDWGDMKRDLDPYFAKVSAGKRGVGLSVAGVQPLVCTVGTGPSRYTHPIACKVQPLSLLVNLSQQDPSAGTGPPQQDCPMAFFNPAPHPTTHTTVGAGSETLVPR